MTLALKAQTANNLQKFSFDKTSRLGVPVMRFLPMTIASPILKYYYKNSDFEFFEINLQSKICLGLSPRVVLKLPVICYPAARDLKWVRSGIDAVKYDLLVTKMAEEQ